MARAEHIDQNTDVPRFSLNRTVSRRAAIGLGTAAVAGGLAALLLGRKNEPAPAATKPKANAPVLGGDNHTVILSPDSVNFFNEQLHGLSFKTVDGKQSLTLDGIVSGKPTLFVCFLTGDSNDNVWAKGTLFPAIDQFRPQLEQTGAQVIALGLANGNDTQRSRIEFDINEMEIAQRYKVVLEEYNPTITPTTGTLMLVDSKTNYAGTYDIGQTREILSAINNLPKGN